MPATPAAMQEINNILNTQIMPSIGWKLDLPQSFIQDMASQGLTTAYDVGQYLQAHTAFSYITPTMPWAQYGMSATSYDFTLLSLNDTWMQMTGQQRAPDSLVSSALQQYRGQMTGSQFRDYLLTQDSIKNTYGWLKYGLDYQQFQQQKVQMRQSFGHDLTDQEAVSQLQYLHAAQGPNVGATAQPTFTQQERKSTQTGVSGNVVR